jgi:hypothetical protein
MLSLQILSAFIVTRCGTSHWPRDLPGHAASFCRNMWEFSHSFDVAIKEGLPSSVGCCTDGYFWRSLIARRAQPLMTASTGHWWLPVDSSYLYSTAWLTFIFVFVPLNVPGYCRSWCLDLQLLMQRICITVLQLFVLKGCETWCLTQETYNDFLVFFVLFPISSDEC